MAWPLKPVVLCFPDHSPGVSRQDQVGARKPSTSTVCSRATASRLLRSRPVLFGGGFDKRREFRDDPGDYRLRCVEDFRPDFLDHVLAHVAARYDDGFSQRKVLRAPDSFMPWLFELFFDAPHQFVELLWVKP